MDVPTIDDRRVTGLCRTMVKACLDTDQCLRRHKSELFGNATGVVLEIGAGFGLNRKYFPGASEYLALEPEASFHTHLLSITNRLLLAPAESIPLPSESVDSVVCSVVMCSISDMPTVMGEIRRVLRPGGSLFLIEHIAAPQGSWLRVAQRLLCPICRKLDGGCRPDSDPSEALRSSGLQPVRWERFTLRAGGPLIRDWLAARLTKT